MYRLVVNQLLNLRQAWRRGHAVAAQAAIDAAQVARSSKAVAAATNGAGDRDAASDGFRRYMMMLLIGAPLLIEDLVARHFLDRAQYPGVVMASKLTQLDRELQGAAVPTGGLTDAVQQLQSAAAPLLHLLSPATRDFMQGLAGTAEE